MERDLERLFWWIGVVGAMAEFVKHEWSGYDPMVAKVMALEHMSWCRP